MSGHEDETLAEVLAAHIAEVLAAHRLYGDECGCGDVDPDTSWREAHLAVLAARDAQVAATARADAWDEGYVSGHSNAMRRMSDEPNAPTSPNPYRAATGDPT
jgi:hypothetical protein